MKTLRLPLPSCSLIPAILLLCAVTTGRAAVLAEDLFDYTSGASAIGNNGGTGFSAAWTGGTTNGRTYTNTAGTFSTPTNYSIPVGDNYAALTAGGSASLGYSRNLTTSIDFNPTSTTTFYFSSLVSMLNNGTSSGDVFFPRFLDNTAANIVSFGMSSSNQIKIQAAVGGSTTSTTTLTEGSSFATATQYLVIGKMVLNPNGVDDVFSFSLIPSTGSVTLTEPTSWTVTTSRNQGGIATQIGYSVNSNGGTLNIDNFVLGDTYASVVSVPEPKAIALLALGTLFVIGHLRRRRVVSA